MIRALVFDFDGLLVDTESAVYESWQEIYREHGQEIPLEHWATILGGSAGATFDPVRFLAECTGLTLDGEVLRARHRKRELELCTPLPLLPGVTSYLSEAQRLGLRLAVASSSSRKWVVGHLERRGIAERFAAILTRDDVERVKPEPDLYLAAVAALGVAPHEAIALEDSPNGLHAALRAGLVAVAVPNVITGRLPLDHADLRITSLAEVPLQSLLDAVAMLEPKGARSRKDTPH